MEQAKALRNILALSNCNMAEARKSEIIDDILTQLVEYQWSLPEGKAPRGTCSVSSVVDTTKLEEDLLKNKKKKNKRKADPLDKEEFVKRFRRDPYSIKKSELNKAIGKKNGYGLVNKLEIQSGECAHDGIKIVKQKKEVLRRILAKHLGVVLETEGVDEITDAVGKVEV